MEAKLRSRMLVSFLSILTLGALGTAYYLWRQNAELQRRSQISSSEDKTNPVESARRLQEGQTLPQFTARDTEGREVQVAARGNGNTLLFIYSPSCDRCEAGMSAWINVGKKLSELRARVRVIALSTGDSYTTVQHARRIKAPYTVVPFPNTDLQKQYGVTEVPLTIVLNEKGVVRAVWNKPLDQSEVADVVETACPDCLRHTDIAAP